MFPDLLDDGNSSCLYRWVYLFLEFTDELEFMESKLWNHFFHLPVIHTHSPNALAPASLVGAAGVLQASLWVHPC